MKLDSQRIYLTRLSMQELNSNYVDWLNDKEVCRFNSHGEVEYTREMAIQFISSLEYDTSQEVWAVYLKDEHVHIGNISLQSIDKHNKCAEIAYLFGEKKYWGKGYAREASEQLIQRAFTELLLHRLYFGTHCDNVSMQKLGEHLGFKQEGVLRDAQFKNGRFNNVLLYGMVRSD
jgi:ribosomal-protein-alanine N-acetyltransferase